MFHLMLGLWAMGLFAVVIMIAVIPLWLGPLLQFLIEIFSRGKAARWVPAVLGGLGLSWSVYVFCVGAGTKFWIVLAYWAVYALLLWAGYGLGRRFREWREQRRRNRPLI